MFIRFQGAILFVVLAAVAGSAAENAILDHRRALGRQHFRIEALREWVARLRLRTERLSTPAALERPLEEGRLDLTRPSSSGRSLRTEPPLLHWRFVPGAT